MTAVLITLSLGLAALCLLRLLRMRKEVRSLARHLRRYNDGEVSGQAVIGGPDRALEALAAEINRHTGLIVQAHAERRRTEDELRQAVANISHDLRTPLTSISGYIQLLEREGLGGDERREAVAIIRKRAVRLKSLLDDFYELSRIDSADYALKPERLRLDTLVPEILMGFYDAMEEKGLEPAFELSERPLVIRADESAVRRVVENLTLNMIRHASGRVEIALAAKDGRAELRLRNRAPQLLGTDPELLFNRFYMADASRSGSSSGLGLSIARGLMVKMGGSLSAELEGDALELTCEWPVA